MTVEPRDSLRMVPKFNYNTRVAVYRKYLQRKDTREYVWQIDALDGPQAGRTVGIATEVPLTGPIGHLSGGNPAITGYISPKPMRIDAAQWILNPNRMGSKPPGVVILTSDCEIWGGSR